METKETYLHKMAKSCLSEWWMEKNYFGIHPLRIDIEKSLSMEGFIYFIPDLIIYNSMGMKVFIEIHYKNPITELKLLKMQTWIFFHGFNPMIIEVPAEWIMKQIKIPDELIHTRYN